MLADVQNYLLNDEKSIVESVFTVNGFSFAGRGQNSGLVFVRMKDYAVRQSTNEKVQALVGRMFGHFAGYKDAMVFPVNPPSIPELGTASGFDFELQDRAGVGHEKLMEARNMLLGMAAKDPSLAQVRPNGLNDNAAVQGQHRPREGERARRVAVDIDQTFSIAWASQYVNNFLDVDNRIKKVYLQGDAQFRMNPEDLNAWYVRNSAGGMVPFSAFAIGHLDLRFAEARTLQRYLGGRNPGRGGTGQVDRPGDDGHRGHRGEAAGGHRLRMDGAVVSGTPVRFAGADPVRHLDSRRVPVSRGAV